MNNEKEIKESIIKYAHRLHEKGMVAGPAGNLSVRAEKVFYRHFVQLASQRAGNPVDHAARYHGLAHRRLRRPTRAIAVQIIDAHREIMIRLHQPAGARNDAVTVVIGIARRRNVELFLQIDQPAHRERRRRVHADPPIPI